jgi:hypothetical protein
MKVFTLLALLSIMAVPAAAAEDMPPLSSGQTLYLPIYSHIWHGDRVVDGRYPLKSQVSALVSIRNTSLKTPIQVISARYYATDGQLLKEYIPVPRTIKPMGTLELFVEKSEYAGGSGANFVIQWQSEQPTNSPVMEALHADIQGHRTLTFITEARPVREDR